METRHERFRYANAEEFKAALSKYRLNLPFSENLGVLAKPLELGEKTIKNRLGIQPMEGCDGTPSGAPAQLTFRRYERFAAGGAGILWMRQWRSALKGAQTPVSFT